MFLPRFLVVRPFNPSTAINDGTSRSPMRKSELICISSDIGLNSQRSPGYSHKSSATSSITARRGVPIYHSPWRARNLYRTRNICRRCPLSVPPAPSSCLEGFSPLTR
jgi:hypothetical protein